MRRCCYECGISLHKKEVYEGYLNSFNEGNRQHFEQLWDDKRIEFLCCVCYDMNIKMCVGSETNEYIGNRDTKMSDKYLFFHLNYDGNWLSRIIEYIHYKIFLIIEWMDENLFPICYESENWEHGVSRCLCGYMISYVDNKISRFLGKLSLYVKKKRIKIKGKSSKKW